MKTNLILASAVLAFASLSFAGTSGTSKTYGTSNSTTQGGTSTHPTKDRSEAVYDQTINPSKIDADREAANRNRQNRISTDTNPSNIDRAQKDTDTSGHKTEEAPRARE